MMMILKDRRQKEQKMVEFNLVILNSYPHLELAHLEE
jgi:hypothetical protein